MVAGGGLNPVAALLAAAQALLCHEPGHAIAAVAFSPLAQFPDAARAAVGLPAVGMDRGNLPGERPVRHRARAGTSPPLSPAEAAAGGDGQVIAERQDGVIVFHRVHPGVTFSAGSERMPNVFFRMSRCWRGNGCAR